MINGASLSVIFEDEHLRQLSMRAFQVASSVIVFRSSPSEKAQIVKMVMKNSGRKRAHALAIGDGGNDVNMI